MFKPEVGTHYDIIRIDKSSVSRDASYFENAISLNNVIDQTVMQEYQEAIIIWFSDDSSLREVASRLIANGIEYTYQFREFKMKNYEHLYGEGVSG